MTASVLKKRLLFIPPVLLGLVVLMIAFETRKTPERVPVREVAVKVRVIKVPEVSFIPRALGYGNVQPGMIWKAIAEVGGQVIEINPHLRKGNIVAKGEVLLRIDPTRYELAVAQIEANIMSNKAKMAELEVKDENTRASLKIEQRSLKLSLNNLDRKQRLLKKRNVSQAAVDQEERNVLARRQAMQTLKNSLNLIPANRQTLEAEQALYLAQLKAARFDIARTTIVAPFDSRIATVNVERTQYASKGTVLAVADSIDTSEISAQISVGRLINLIQPGGQFPAQAADITGRLPGLLSLKAKVRLNDGGINAEWVGRFARINDSIDPKTRTVGIIVAVDNPYRQTIPGVRPPLTKNMFVEVELSGKPIPGQKVIPRSALHNGQVYVVDTENRLKKRDLEIAFLQADLAVVKSGLKAGETIVVSDPGATIDGMLLDPVIDKDALETLISEAVGTGAIK